MSTHNISFHGVMWTIIPKVVLYKHLIHFTDEFLSLHSPAVTDQSLIKS